MAFPNSRPKLSKALDIYRKIDPDLTRATPVGAALSVSCMIIMVLLFFMELQDYFTPDISTRVVLDPGNEDDDLRMNFNLTIERVACPYISIELHNQLGTHRTNITRNIARYKVKSKDNVRHTVGQIDEPRRILIEDNPSSLSSGEVERNENIRPVDLTVDNFEEYVARYDVVLVNFYAPWCVWSKRLEPVWVAAASDFSKEYANRQVGVAWVDCTRSDQTHLCHMNHINAFPTIVSFRGGDTHTVDHYHGDRTISALKAFVNEELVKVQQSPDEMHPGERALQAIELADKLDGDGTYTPAVEGCRLEGFILAPKVPGTLVFATVSSEQTVDGSKLNTSHEFHHLSFGRRISPVELERLPHDVKVAMHKLDGKKYESRMANLTHEHFVKIVGSTFNYYSHGSLSFYKFLHYASPFHSSSTVLPSIKIHFDLASTHVIVDEKSKPFYRFITNLFAIVGGTFTVFGLLDTLFDTAQQALKRKVQLGKAV